MKKFLFLAAMLLLACLPLTSCGGDDEPTETNNAKATFLMDFSQDLLDASNILIYYKANDEVRWEPINNRNWTKTVNSDRLPAEFGVMYRFSPKDLTKDKYNLKCTLTISITTSTGTNYSKQITIIDEPDVEKSRVAETLKNYNNHSTGFRVTKEGDVNITDGLKYE